MQIDQRRAAQQYRNKVNNAQGQFFERAIKAACALYSERGRADVDKTPEPFRVLEKSRDGIFKGRFTARAQPDFQGTLDGGRSIVFEAKYTTGDRHETGSFNKATTRRAGTPFPAGRACRCVRWNRKRLLFRSVVHLAGHETMFRKKVRNRGGP